MSMIAPHAALPERLFLRADLPGIYTGKLTVEGKEVARHYRATVTDEGVHLADLTEHVAGQLVTRARAREARKFDLEMSMVARVGAASPIDCRGQHDAVIVDPAGTADGSIRHRVVAPLASLYQSGHIFAYHLRAGESFAADVEVMQGGRPGPDPSRELVDGAGGGRSWEDFLVDAGGRVSRARAACEALPEFEGVSPWAVVQAVTVNGVYLTAAAGSKAQSVLRRHRTALRIGLEALAIAYQHPLRGDVETASVRVQGVMADVEMILEPDETWRARWLNGRPWVAVAKEKGGIFSQARRALLDVVAAETGGGHGVKAKAQVEAALRADRIRARAEEARRYEEAASRQERVAKELEEEKKRVVG